MDSDRPAQVVDEPAFRHFLEEAALWYRTQDRATDVVDAAVQSLLGGVESPAFVLIAGLARAEAQEALGDLLPEALEELGVGCLRYDDPNNDVLAAAALARSFLYGHLEAQQLTQAAHQLFGHDCHPVVAELSDLDDSFDTVGFSASPYRDDLVRKTHAAATALREQAEKVFLNAQQ